MKWRYGLVIVILSILISSIQGQVVKRDSKIRLGFGLAGFVFDDANYLINYFKKSALEHNPQTEFSPSKFKDHLFYTLEYEVDINQSYTYLINFEIHNDNISASDVDFDNYTTQYMDLSWNFITCGIAIVYYYPFSRTKFGDVMFFSGFGLDILYTNIDVYHYYNKVTEAPPQEINYNGTSFNLSGKGFFGMEIPFSEAIFIQVRGEFAYRKASNFSGKNETKNLIPIDPSPVDRNQYNLSGFSGNLGLGFYF